MLRWRRLYKDEEWFGILENSTEDYSEWYGINVLAKKDRGEDCCVRLKFHGGMIHSKLEFKKIIQKSSYVIELYRLRKLRMVI